MPRASRADQARFEAKALAQGGLCAICKARPKRLVRDHDHATGQQRDLLCHHCNVMLGMARDNVFVLAAGIKYLRRHENEADSEDDEYDDEADYSEPDSGRRRWVFP